MSKINKIFLNKVPLKYIKKNNLLKPTKKQFWNFNDYAQKSFKIGSKFRLNSKNYYLKEIRDQFNQKLEKIPIGWQTMCLFEELI